jgi:hypothetical protein
MLSRRRYKNPPREQLDSIDRLIQNRAYTLWKEDGCRSGRDLEYWLKAEADVIHTRETAHSVEGSRKALEDATLVGSGLWLSYLFFLFYLGISVSTVTSVDLLVENSVKLPFLAVDLPLIEFFTLLPIVFLVVHAYTLVHFVILSAKAGQYNSAVQAHLPYADEIQEALRQQLPNNIFVNFLAGPRDVTEGGLGVMLKIIAWTTLIIAPILLLLVVQIKFLPFHNIYITWVHRLILLVDLGLIWMLWPAVLACRGSLQWPRFTLAKKAVVATVLTVAFSSVVASFPGEPQEKIADIPLVRWIIPTNTLELSGFNVFVTEKIDDLNKVVLKDWLLDLSGHDLRRAVLANANLTKVNLSLADLRGAILANAQLPGSNLFKAKLEDASLVSAELSGANLFRANLERASLMSAHLQGAWLDRADLRHAFAGGANFQGASLLDADLEVGNFGNAHLEGTALSGAHIDGASFDGAFVWMADIRGAIGTPSTLIDNFKIAPFDVNAITQYVSKTVLPGTQRDGALAQIKRQLDPSNMMDESKIEKAWAKLPSMANK